MASNVRVAVRVRPLSRKEQESECKNIVSTDGNSISITNIKVDSNSEYGDSREKTKQFTFDFCYDSTFDHQDGVDIPSQELIYQDLGTEVLQAAFEGYNACMFAYGQTGTGKTYTMMGYPDEVGMTPRICEALFSHSDDCLEDNVTFRIEISYLEIYNERVRDLLARPKKKHEKYTLKIREHPKEGPYVQDLSRHVVKDFQEIQTLLDIGNNRRTTAATHVHQHSSRSHSIVTVNFTQAKMDDGLPSEILSKIHLVDLAGSERADPTYHAEYKGRIKEGSNINKSLVTLGTVIKALAEKSLLYLSSETMGSSQSLAGSTDMLDSRLTSPSRRVRALYIPYRDSVLTWLLKDSLGGNSKTLMLATVSPASNSYRETLSTLRYAQRAKSIINKPKVNEDPNVALIRELRNEIERLRKMVEAPSRSDQRSSHGDILYFAPRRGLPMMQIGGRSLEDIPVSDPGAIIKEQLKKKEAIANQLTQTWEDKWKDSNNILEDQDLSIRGLNRRSSSYGVVIDSLIPHLVGIDDDILNTGIVIYHLRGERTLIGQDEASADLDIGLKGSDILPLHCQIENIEGVVSLVPEVGAACTVNGSAVTSSVVLKQGDIVLLGKTNVFRFNNPAEAARLREHRHSQEAHLPVPSSLGQNSSSPFSSVTDLNSSPTRQQVEMFNPNSKAAKFCVDLDEKFETEEEKIQAAKNELSRVRNEIQRLEDSKQELEEVLWSQHGRQQEELQAERIRLSHMDEVALAERDRLLQDVVTSRFQILTEEEKYQQTLQEEVNRLQGVSTTSTSTEAAQMEHSASQTESAFSEGEITPPISGEAGRDIRTRRQSLEGKMKGLVQKELLHTLSLRDKMIALAQEDEAAQEDCITKQHQVRKRRKAVEEKETIYRKQSVKTLSDIEKQACCL